MFYGKNLSISEKKWVHTSWSVKGLRKNQGKKVISNSSERVKTRVFWRKTKYDDVCTDKGVNKDKNSVVKKSKTQQKRCEHTILLSNRFEVLSDLVDESNLSNIDSVKGVKLNSEDNQLIGVEKVIMWVQMNRVNKSTPKITSTR